MYVIVIDCGTSSLRTILYSDTGKLVKSFGKEYYSYYPKANYVEQDPISWKDSSLELLKKMSDYCKENSYEVSAVSITSQRSSMIAMDEDGNHLYPTIMWQDKRTDDVCNRLIDEYGLAYFYNKTGLRSNPYFVLPKILWFQENENDLYKKSVKFIGVQDYVVYQLVGDYYTDYSQACRTMLMDIKNFEWDKDLLKICNITEDKLPKLVPPGTKVAAINNSVAEYTGLKKGTPFIITGGDQQNAALALGVTKQGKAEANTGTGSFIISAVNEPSFDKDCRVLCQASAISGKWIMEAGIFNTGAIYRWFRNNFYPEIKENNNAYDIINKEAEKSGPGANGVTMLPHFQGSAAPYWNSHAKGMFFNLSLANNREDFARSILEGISVEIATNLNLIQKLTYKIDSVSVAGGMTRSDLFCQIQANLFNRKVVRYQNSEASSLGSAMLSFVSLGRYKNADEAYANMVGEKLQIFNPEEDDTKAYERVLNRNIALYDALDFGDIYSLFVEE